MQSLSSFNFFPIVSGYGGKEKKKKKKKTTLNCRALAGVASRNRMPKMYSIRTFVYPMFMS